MAKKIFKYALKATEIQQVQLPEDAQVLCIQTQNEIPCIWVLVDPLQSVKKRTFEIFGTGHNIPSNGVRKYVGTYQLNNGQLVFHCFELLSLL